MAIQALILEDDTGLAAMLADYLTHHGVDVQVAHDGGTAWEMVQAQPPDVVLADLMVPGLSGAEFIAQLRGVPELAAIPVIAMSASMDPNAQGPELQWLLHADATFAKPLVLRELLAAVRRLVEERQGG